MNPAFTYNLTHFIALFSEEMNSVRKTTVGSLYTQGGIVTLTVMKSVQRKEANVFLS
jgi:hypothetical protein